MQWQNCPMKRFATPHQFRHDYRYPVSLTQSVFRTKIGNQRDILNKRDPGEGGGGNYST